MNRRYLIDAVPPVLFFTRYIPLSSSPSSEVISVNVTLVCNTQSTHTFLSMEHYWHRFVSRRVCHKHVNNTVHECLRLSHSIDEGFHHCSELLLSLSLFISINFIGTFLIGEAKFDLSLMTRAPFVLNWSEFINYAEASVRCHSVCENYDNSLHKNICGCYLLEWMDSRSIFITVCRSLFGVHFRFLCVAVIDQKHQNQWWESFVANSAVVAIWFIRNLKPHVNRKFSPRIRWNMYTYRWSSENALNP